MRKYFLILTGLFLLFLIACNHDFQRRTPPKAVKGILDLTDWNFKSDGAVDLSGEYEFYWKQHLAPSDFAGPTLPQKTGFITVPGFWNRYELNEKKLPGDGYATYRLKILFHDQKEHLALKLLSMGTAYTLFLNGQKASSIGIAGKDRETAVPRYFPQVLDCKIDANQIELIFQVSNFHHRRGGAWEVIKLGGKKASKKSRRTDLALISSYSAVFSLWHCIIFVFLRSKKRIAHFYISVFSVF